jgi:glycosyltransferase involved in cell wall biosynthesis
LYPQTKGGVELRIRELGRRLAKKGHEVHVFGLRYAGMEREFEKDGMRYHCIMDAPRLYTGSGTRSIAEAIAYATALFPALLKAGRFDAVDCQNFPYFPVFSARLACAMTGSTLYVTWHEFWGTEYWQAYLGKFKGLLGSLVERLALIATKRAITVSPSTRERMAKAGKPGAKIVPNGADLAEISKANPSKEKFDLVFAGRLIGDKHADIFLETVALLKKVFPKIKAAVVGDGPERGKLETLASKLGVEKNVRFAGFVNSRGELLGIFKSSKLFLLPSTREGFGITLLEALACGLPAITSNAETNAAAGLVDGKNGFAVQANAQEFYEKAKLLLSNAAMRKKFSAQAKKSAKNYAWDKIAEEFEKAVSTK